MRGPKPALRRETFIRGLVDEIVLNAKTLVRSIMPSPDVPGPNLMRGARPVSRLTISSRRLYGARVGGSPGGAGAPTAGDRPIGGRRDGLNGPRPSPITAGGAGVAQW